MQNIQFKHPSLIEEYASIRPELQMIVEDIALFCKRQNQPFIITDILSDAEKDKKLKRVSSSHSEGRAIDVRSKDWPDEFIKRLMDYFPKRYERYAAISKETGKPRLMYFHSNGNGDHLHLQVRR
jgi:hypothetical protein